ncbi:HNH endonuclease signature motif containing protein [Xenorhabdus bovienii]|uniref:HNH endonuclease signature motif containing protein n=1 Tax=Xenorhabdus bovienii TaxID=40576 RepID=UPI00237D1EE3|nr:HNH endonuclease signature motif containing protein [Xenorhabdus bovienii]MDE1476542.1 HNH endonuclease [Xenorhabdus bovienii]MDE9463488.1 HNH endonuclease [Xenorhabdus bovienii]MDE9471025.1 HNH endonuclease [Xenorhabdus bovienii]
MSISQSRLKEVLNYNPETGKFIWIKRTGPRCKLKSSAGRLDTHGYFQVMIDKKYYFLHRLAFLYMNGELPEPELVVDHINGNPSDNRWLNLRQVTKSVNQQNRIKATKRSTSGLLGAYWCKTRKVWHSRILAEGNMYELGVFESAESAHCAYIKAKRKLHIGCSI